MDFDRLATFVTFANTQSFSKTALAMHLSQPAVSSRMRSLEEEVGLPLFHHVGQRVALTKAGKVLLGHAELCLREWRSTQVALQELKDRAPNAYTGHLVLGGTPTVSTYWFPELFAYLHERNPELRLSARIGDSYQVVDMVLDGSVDAGLITLLVPHSSLSQAQAFTEWFVPVVRSGHPLLAKATLTINDLAAERIVAYNSGSNYWQLVKAEFATAGLEPNLALEVDHVETIKGVIRRDDYLSFLPEKSIEEEIREGALQRLRVTPDIRFGMQRYTVYRKRKRIPDSVKMLCDALRDIGLTEYVYVG